MTITPIGRHSAFSLEVLAQRVERRELESQGLELGEARARDQVLDDER